jgi:hypothetical protein
MGRGREDREERRDDQTQPHTTDGTPW